MPAEHMFGQQHTIEGDDGPQIVPLVDVRWNREGGYVQIVTRAQRADGGRVADDSPDSHVTDGMYVDLDRAGINRVIRNLRRARDQAFGRDE